MARIGKATIDGRVTRTVTYTTADVVMVAINDGKPITTTGTISLSGDYKSDADRFVRACRESGEYPSVAVAFNLRTETELRAMTMTSFIRHSERVEDVADYAPDEDDD